MFPNNAYNSVAKYMVSMQGSEEGAVKHDAAMTVEPQPAVDVLSHDLARELRQKSQQLDQALAESVEYKRKHAARLSCASSSPCIMASMTSPTAI